eukprot:12217442-Alexandrium_andersonii.AAC.1
MWLVHAERAARAAVLANLPLPVLPRLLPFWIRPAVPRPLRTQGSRPRAGHALALRAGAGVCALHAGGLALRTGVRALRG